MLSQFSDFLYRNTKVIQPLLSDLLTGTILHGLLDIVTGYICKQTIYPYTDFFLVLSLELTLTVDRPAQQPAGILAAYDAAGNNLAGSGITLADIGDIRNDLVIQCSNSCGFPVGLGNIGTELFRMSEGWILCGDILPETPNAAGTNLSVSVGSVVLITINSALCAASIGNKNQVIFGKDDTLFHTVYFAFNGFGNLLVILDVKDNVGNLSIKLEVNTGSLQIFLHGQDQGLILVIFGKFQCTEIREP